MKRTKITIKNLTINLNNWADGIDEQLSDRHMVTQDKIINAAFEGGLLAVEIAMQEAKETLTASRKPTPKTEENN